MIELNKIYNKDCIIGMKQIPDNSIDLIATDVPYLCTSRGGSGTMGGYWKSNKAKSGKIFDCNNAKIEDYLPEFYRILKDNSHCYIMCNNFNLIHFLRVIDESAFHFVKSLIWDKVKKICGRYYMGQYEYILLLRKGKDRPVNDCSISDILSYRNIKHKDKDGQNIHDSEKPVQLFSTLIRQSSNENELVLDPFMGSGTTAIACIRENRNFLGFELDKKYYDIANNRIIIEQAQLLQRSTKRTVLLKKESV